MKFNVAFPGGHHIPTPPDWVVALRPPQYQDIAAAVDELGYHAITTSEHHVMPLFEVPRLGPYWTHALTVMSFVAGATRRVRVDASVLEGAATRSGSSVRASSPRSTATSISAC